MWAPGGLVHIGGGVLICIIGYFMVGRCHGNSNNSWWRELLDLKEIGILGCGLIIPLSALCWPFLIVIGLVSAPFFGIAKLGKWSRTWDFKRKARQAEAARIQKLEETARINAAQLLAADREATSNRLALAESERALRALRAELAAEGKLGYIDTSTMKLV